MPLMKNEEMKTIEINMEAAMNVVKQTAISPKEGWDGWVMRIFTLKKDGFTPFHTHDWPHINYIIKGKRYSFYRWKGKSGFSRRHSLYKGRRETSV